MDMHMKPEIIQVLCGKLSVYGSVVGPGCRLWGACIMGPATEQPHSTGQQSP